MIITDKIIEKATEFGFKYVRSYVHPSKMVDFKPYHGYFIHESNIEVKESVFNDVFIIMKDDLDATFKEMEAFVNCELDRQKKRNEQ